MKQPEVVVINVMNKEYFENYHIEEFIGLKEKASLPFALVC